MCPLRYEPIGRRAVGPAGCLLKVPITFRCGGSDEDNAQRERLHQGGVVVKSEESKLSPVKCLVGGDLF